MNRERLERAILIMEWVRDQRMPFDMGEWFDSRLAPENCHTAACFAGWCARDKEFQKQGLGIEKVFDRPSPVHQDENGSYAVAKFFEINTGTAEWICFPGFYVTPFGIGVGIEPDHVIARLRDILGGKVVDDPEEMDDVDDDDDEESDF